MSPKASLEAWLIGLIKQGVAQALAEAEGAADDDLRGMENRLTAQITSLPGLLGGQLTSAVSTALTPIAAQVESILGLLNKLNPFGGSTS